jgi:hypothetical protein
MMRAVALALAALLILVVPTATDWRVNNPPEPSKCIAGGQEVWKVFCAQFWTELWAEDGNDDDDEEEPAKPEPGSYYDCTNVANSKDCKLTRGKGI